MLILTPLVGSLLNKGISPTIEECLAGLFVKIAGIALIDRPLHK